MNIDMIENRKYIENIVTESYKDILKREPDFEGLLNYANKIENGLSIVEFQDILKSSDEYFNNNRLIDDKNSLDDYKKQCNIDVEESFDEVFSEMEINEVYKIIREIERIKPYMILEIGVKNGGTLNIWRKMIPQNGSVIGIDSDNTIDMNIIKDPRLYFIVGDSLNCKTYRDFINILDDKEIDYLFIDGGHEYREVKSDFYTYGWHVRKGGLIAFHDIYLDSSEINHGSSKQFWNEIKERSGKYWEVVCEIHDHTGTGIIKKIM